MVVQCCRLGTNVAKKSDSLGGKSHEDEPSAQRGNAVSVHCRNLKMGMDLSDFLGPRSLPKNL